jgi:hypothetical protein
MTIQRPRVRGVVCAVTSVALFWVIGLMQSNANAQTEPDILTLELQKPENVTVSRTYDRGRSQFTVAITWEEAPDSLTAFIHQPDTTGWHLVSPPDSISTPRSRGAYSGNIDRTAWFKAQQESGRVGEGTIVLQYLIRGEERWFGQINVGAGYTPGSWIPIFFSTNLGDTLDLGLELSFSEGNIDGQAEFIVGMEDYEGFHVWRGVKSDGSDLQVIGEISKEEAHRAGFPGGNFVDSLYLYVIIPALRTVGVYHSPFTIECLGFEIRADLEDNELWWFDCGAINGFTYYYLVTNFDRGYNVPSSRQGLSKVDRCQPLPDASLSTECKGELVEVPIYVDVQDDLKQVYAVPNPYRSGGSRLTTPNYHNFPDDMVRFVNVPLNCKIKIYNVAGDLIWEYEHYGPGGNIEWNVRNQSDEDVASGVYVFKIEDSVGGTVFGRLVVIR